MTFEILTTITRCQMTLTLREANEEDEIDGEEAEEISDNHLVDHHHKLSNCFEAPVHSNIFQQLTK